jgi:enoyl-CoA hydratase/carnithine racemase
MLFSGRVVAATEGVTWGLVSRVTVHEQLLDEAEAVLRDCCRAAPGARSDLKRSFDAYYGLYDRIGMALSLQGEESVEGYKAFRERRSPTWVDPRLQIDGRI